MTLTDLFNLGTAIVAVASALDAIIPPTSNRFLKPIKTTVSFIAMNFGHSENVAPSEAIKQCIEECYEEPK